MAFPFSVELVFRYTPSYIWAPLVHQLKLDSGVAGFVGIRHDV